jgi:DNA-binding transcriptional MerR regulator/uncharacterized glyoxalase superfamily protein PhnB
MGDDEPDVLRKIGEIAAATGMTVRTLHYYEEIGLITPTARTDAGHRVYGSDALEQLYRISFLRRLGLPLDGVRATLATDAGDLGSVMATHLAEVEERLAAEGRLRNRLVQLVDALETNEIAAGDFLNVLEDMAMLDTTINRRISILVYADIEAAHDYLIRVFGLGPGEIMRDPDSNAVHAEIEAGDGEFWLHLESPEFQLASPRTLGGSSSTMAVMVDDVDAHHANAVEQGADIRYAPVDQPYGYREYSAVDLEGHLWSFMKPLA